MTHSAVIWPFIYSLYTTKRKCKVETGLVRAALLDRLSTFGQEVILTSLLTILAWKTAAFGFTDHLPGIWLALFSLSWRKVYEFFSVCVHRHLSVWASVASLVLFCLRYFLVSLCQLQRCPTYRCLPSLHLTACLKKMNISVGKEGKALPDVFISRCRPPRERAAQRHVAPLFHPLLFFFILPKSLRQTEEEMRRVSDRTKGRVTGDDTAEQSLNFSQRPDPLNLQVPVSFCRHCLNIVAVLIQKRFLLPPWSHSRRRTSGCYYSIPNRLYIYI